MAYAILRTDKMMSTRVESMLVTFRYQDSSADAPIENGNIVELDGLMEGEREIFLAKAPTTTSTLDTCVLVNGVELLYDERASMRNLNKFRNEAGDNVRGRHLHSGDIFSVTKEAIDGEAAVGNAIELQAGTKLKCVASPTASTTQVGTVIELDGDYIVILVA